MFGRVPRKRQYGEGGLTRDGARWRIRWRQDGQRRSSTHPTRELAMAALRGIVGDLARGRAGLAPDPANAARLSAIAVDWFAGRAGPHNRNNDDECRKWRNHLEPAFGRLRPDDLTIPRLLQWIAEKQRSGRIREREGAGDGLSRATVKQLLAILSSLYTHLTVTGRASTNPVRLLPRDAKRRVKPDYDWRNTPYVKVKADIRRIYQALPEPINVAYAIGVMRGLRPGEIRALTWARVDLEARLLHVERQVRNGVLGPPKGGRARTVTLSDELVPILAEWRLKTGGTGLVIPPRRRGGRIAFIGEKALNRELSAALERLELPPLTWYEATKHTFGSHWSREGGSLETLRIIFGQSSSEVTKRYAHLQPDQLRPEDTNRAQVDLRAGEVVALPVPAARTRDEFGTKPESTKSRKTNKIHHMGP